MEKIPRLLNCQIIQKMIMKPLISLMKAMIFKTGSNMPLEDGIRLQSSVSGEKTSRKLTIVMTSSSFPTPALEKFAGQREVHT